jgi:hypothetical protein
MILGIYALLVVDGLILYLCSIVEDPNTGILKKKVREGRVADPYPNREIGLSLNLSQTEIWVDNFLCTMAARGVYYVYGLLSSQIYLFCRVIAQIPVF